jgi:hypothetical protein
MRCLYEPVRACASGVGVEVYTLRGLYASQSKVAQPSPSPSLNPPPPQAQEQVEEVNLARKGVLKYKHSVGRITCLILSLLVGLFCL